MSDGVNVRILDREFLVGCQPDERDALLSAAQLLDTRMREIRGNNRMVALERIAVLAALNLAAELLASRRDGGERETALRRGIAEMNRHLDLLLAEGRID